ncbi:MAG: hypothetical protein NTW59_03820 [Candidatus Diapherotrites archaeon]|nr:hypothetical protein [Candidatus Diapherotrites archaeon]
MPLFTPPKIPKNFARIGNTRIYLGGAQHMDLADPEIIELLKRVKVSKVFCLYPISGKGLERLPGLIREKVDWSFPQKLRENGIQVSTIMRNPDHFREYESFAREVNQVGRGNILVMCYSGRHTSAAYAFYYLAKETPLTRTEARKVFWTPDSAART